MLIPLRIRGQELRLRLLLERYADGKPAVRLIDEDGMPYFKASLTFPGLALAPEEFAFKTYSENEGLLDAMIAAGVIEKTGRSVNLPTYAGTVPVCRLLRTVRRRNVAMMHRSRRWVVSEVGSIEELAKMLTTRTFTLCSGFVVAGHPNYLFLNDATHEDGAGEYAAIGGGFDGPHVQVESLTFSWMDSRGAEAVIHQVLAGEFDLESFAHPVKLTGRLDRPETHRRCHLCA